MRVPFFSSVSFKYVQRSCLCRPASLRWLPASCHPASYEASLPQNSQNRPANNSLLRITTLWFGPRRFWCAIPSSWAAFWPACPWSGDPWCPGWPSRPSQMPSAARPPYCSLLHHSYCCGTSSTTESIQKSKEKSMKNNQQSTSVQLFDNWLDIGATPRKVISTTTGWINSKSILNQF